jgi:hypothetical protein
MRSRLFGLCFLAASLLIGAFAPGAIAACDPAILKLGAEHSCTALPNRLPPLWAVSKQKRETPGITADDPIWQHAICLEKTRTVIWCFP